MKKTLLTILISLLCIAIFAQKPYTIAADSALFTGRGVGGTIEVQIKNSTSGVNGFMYNAGGGKTAFVTTVINTMADLQSISASSLTSPLLQEIYHVKGFYNPNDGVSGDFMLIDTASASLVPGMVYPVGSTKAYVRIWDKADNINPMWWGVIASDTTVDNAPAINSAIAYAALVGAKVVLNSNKT